MKPDQLILSEKYRPHTIEECILPPELKENFQSFIADGNIPNLILSGSSGTGKTTIARALAEELNSPMLFVNASMDRNIDTLRGSISDFVSTRSLVQDGKKIVILDEADNLNAESTQKALRAFMEQFHNVAFIMTANAPHKIIPALHSRSHSINFDSYITHYTRDLKRACYMRLREILEVEGIGFEKNALASLIENRFPDIRSMLNYIDANRLSGVVHSKDYSGYKDFEDLLSCIKKKNIANTVSWIKAHGSIDPNQVIKMLFESVEGNVSQSFYPMAYQILAEGQRDMNIVANKQIQLMATVLSMLQLEWE